MVHFGAVVADAPSPLSTPRSAAGQAQLRLGKPLRKKCRASPVLLFKRAGRVVAGTGCVCLRQPGPSHVRTYLLSLGSYSKPIRRLTWRSAPRGGGDEDLTDWLHSARVGQAAGSDRHPLMQLHGCGPHDPVELPAPSLAIVGRRLPPAYVRLISLVWSIDEERRGRRNIDIAKSDRVPAHRSPRCGPRRCTRSRCSRP